MHFVAVWVVELEHSHVKLLLNLAELHVLLQDGAEGSVTDALSVLVRHRDFFVLG